MVMAYVEALSGIDWDFGKMLYQALRENTKFPAHGAFWLFESDPGEWHLLIATPRVDLVGPRRAYGELAEVTRSIVKDSSQLLKVKLISPKMPLYLALRSVFGKTASVEGARLGNTQVDGIYIDDAYLYEVR